MVLDELHKESEWSNGFNEDATLLFNKLFHELYSPLCLFAERILGDTFLAGEIIDNVFLRLWARQADFDNPFSIKAFLYICTKNACFNQLEKEKTLEKKKSRYQYIQTPTEDFVLNEIIRTEVLCEILAAMEKLPTECRKVMNLGFVEGLSNKEIAEKLNLSINTVKTQKQRGLAVLRKKFSSNFLSLVSIPFL
jgi:RNA polymerase sigma-70 factor (ECF subfamily)